MAKLNLTWTDMGSYSVTTGENVETTDLSTARAILESQYQDADKPFLVYLTSSDPKAVREQEVVDGVTFMDERIMIGAKAFTLVKGNGDEIGEDHPFHRYLAGKKFPRIVVFNAAGEKVGKLEGRSSPSKLFSVMRKAFRHDYKGDLNNIVKDYQKVLTQLDTLDAMKQAMDEKEKHASTKRAKKEIEKKRAEIAKEEEEIREAEEKVLDFRRRSKA